MRVVFLRAEEEYDEENVIEKPIEDVYQAVVKTPTLSEQQDDEELDIEFVLVDFCLFLN